VFLPEDREHAENKQHLTLELSKKIFFESNSAAVRFTHFSTRYEMEKQAFFSKLYSGMGNKVFAKNTL
jgi:ribonuclease BN (tRNA processing enzyme)